MGAFAFKCAQAALSANTFTYFIKPNSNEISAFYFLSGEFKTFYIRKNKLPFNFGEVESIALAKNKILVVGGTEGDGFSSLNEQYHEDTLYEISNLKMFNYCLKSLSFL